jgi:hypothetical protein
MRRSEDFCEGRGKMGPDSAKIGGAAHLEEGESLSGRARPLVGNETTS